MKLQKFLAVAALVAATSSTVFAGSVTLPPAPPVAEPDPIFSGEVSVGYDTFYIFRGEELWEQVVWGQVEIAFALSENVSLSLIPWYLSATDDDYTELNLLPSLTVDAGFAEITAGYAGYIYPRGSYGYDEGIDDEHEASLGVAKTVGIFDFAVLAAYNFDREATYLESSVGTSFALGEAVSLDPSVALGYSADYYGVDGLTHVLATLALPVQLTGTAVLTPYVAANIPLEVLDENQDTEIFGGVSLAVSF